MASLADCTPNWSFYSLPIDTTITYRPYFIVDRMHHRLYVCRARPNISAFQCVTALLVVVVENRIVAFSNNENSRQRLLYRFNDLFRLVLSCSLFVLLGRPQKIFFPFNFSFRQVMDGVLHQLAILHHSWPSVD